MNEAPSRPPPVGEGKIARFFEVVGLLKMTENFCFPMIIRTFVFGNH